MEEDIPKEFMEIDNWEMEEWWILRFNGSPSLPEGGAAVMLIRGGKEEVAMSYKLAFPCINNEAEYEALILGLQATKARRAKLVEIQGDSKLIRK